VPIWGPRPALLQERTNFAVHHMLQLSKRGPVRLHRGYPSHVRGRTLSAVMATIIIAIACDSAPHEERSIVTGVVIKVDAAGLTKIRSFLLKRRDREYRIFVTTRTRFAFTPSHLHEHLATAEPVRVVMRRTDGRLVAVDVRDG
jgi:hypothetical protein